MLLLIMIAEIAALLTLGYQLAAWAQGTPRVRDWSLPSPYPRHFRPERDLTVRRR
ncbi:hypothetical protein [Amycolatopsis albispora]|uniref:hypothetical protein n=1 Tax=Amycolatopsis albispora TaxID=1804986 RepID=UPI0013B3E454|nr:hypothetical protein [Amycolatopsis albispora]